MSRATDHEVEVARHPPRPQHHEGHAPHEYRFEAERPQVLHNRPDRSKMICWVRHLTTRPDKCRAAGR